MPTPQAPLLLLDNLFDTIVQYPTASLIPSSETTGHEALRVADYRRERSWWQPATVGERPHWNLNRNTVGGSGNGLKAQAAIARANTSHTFAFLVRMMSGTTGQVLLHASGSTNLSLWRDNGGVYSFNNAGTQRNFGARSTDDVWHTIIFVMDGSTSLCRVYIDGVQSGTDQTYTPQGFDTTTGAFFVGCSTSQGLSCVGLLGQLLYYTTALAGAAVTTLHNALSSATAPSTTNLSLWLDASKQQGNQLFNDQQSGVSFALGTTSAIEFTAPNKEPMWGGGHSVAAYAGTITASAQADALWLDRGHNLWGQSVIVEGTSDPAALVDYTTDRAWPALAVPALNADGSFPVGGDPTVGFCVTEEGALYTLFTGSGRTGSCTWRVRVFSTSLSFLPQVPGIIVGARLQLLSYSNTYDDDEGGRKMRTEESDAGYVATGRVYAWRTASLDLAVIGDSEYDGRLRAVRKLMFARGAPAFLALNFGMYPERSFLAQLDGAKWSMAKKGVYRSGKIPLREVGPVVL